MSDDLISRSRLLEHMENWAFQECPIEIGESESDVYKTIKEAMKMIQEQPTAYDVDNVVGRLEEESKKSVLVTLKAAFEVATEIVKSEAKG